MKNTYIEYIIDQVKENNNTSKELISTLEQFILGEIDEYELSVCAIDNGLMSIYVFEKKKKIDNLF